MATGALQRSSSNAMPLVLLLGALKRSSGFAPAARELLDNCLVPKHNVLGAIGQGYKVAIETLNEGRIGIGAQMVGVAQGALEAAITYAKQRRQFGKTIAEFQSMQFQLADMATQLAARLLVYNAARLKDAGSPYATGDMAKYFASQMAEHITSKAMKSLAGWAIPKTPSGKNSSAMKIGALTKARPSCSSARLPNSCCSSDASGTEQVMIFPTEAAYRAYLQDVQDCGTRSAHSCRRSNAMS